MSERATSPLRPQSASARKVPRWPIVLIAGLAVAAALGAAAFLLARGSTAAELLCRDVASAVGLDFRGAYGPTVAPGAMAVVMQRNMGNGAAVGDYDRDGDLDVYLLAQNALPNRLFRNELVPTGQKRFSDVTEAAGVGDTGLSRVAHFVDLDDDGLLDLAVFNDADPAGRLPSSKLYRNLGDGRFEDQAAAVGFRPVGFIVGGATFADYNGDGRLDLYISYWTQELGAEGSRQEIRGAFPGENTLFRNDGGFRFTNVNRETGLGGLSRDSFTAIFTDFDGDIDPDLYVAVDHREDVYYENTAGRFVDRTREASATHKGNDMGVAVTSFESDGLLDLYLTNISDPAGQFGSGQGNALLVSTRSPGGGIRFEDRAAQLGIADTGWGWGTAFLDMNLDGSLDLFAAQGMDEFIAVTSPILRDARATLFMGDGQGGFAELAGRGCDVEGDQRAVVPFDYDRDGDSDILITQVGYRAILLENQTRGQRWLTVDLGRAGTLAIGAQVTVRAADRRTTQLVLAGGSYLAGPPTEATFGLGAARAADEVRIRWRDGRETVLTNVAGDRLVRPAPDGTLE